MASRAEITATVRGGGPVGGEGGQGSAAGRGRGAKFRLARSATPTATVKINVGCAEVLRRVWSVSGGECGSSWQTFGRLRSASDLTVF